MTKTIHETTNANQQKTKATIAATLMTFAFRDTAPTITKPNSRPSRPALTATTQERGLSSGKNGRGVGILAKPNARGKPHRSAKHGGYQQAELVGVGLTDGMDSSTFLSASQCQPTSYGVRNGN